jgi:hypothetical protein
MRKLVAPSLAAYTHHTEIGHSRMTRTRRITGAIGLTAAALLITFGFASAAHAATVETSRPLPPQTAAVQPANVQPKAAALVATANIGSHSSISHRCYPAGVFLSGGTAASWLGSSVAGDSGWPDPSANGGRVWAANGGWVGGNMQWAMVSPAADHNTRVYVYFRNSCG